jgi:hypothetical protein
MKTETQKIKSLVESINSVLKESDMKSAEAVQKEFSGKLQSLLAEYDADISGESVDGRPVIEITIPEVSKNGAVTREYVSFTIAFGNGKEIRNKFRQRAGGFRKD